MPDDGSTDPLTLRADALLEADAAGLDLPTPAGPSRFPLTFRALRHRNYRLYFCGQIVSLTGTWMQTQALMILAYNLTGQSRWTAWIVTAQILPGFLLGAWTGSLADRWPKRSLIFCTQAVLSLLAVLLALLPQLGTPEPWQLLLVAAGAGVVLAVDLPARLAFVMDMVGREDLPNAVALNSVLFNVARVLGPLIGVVVLQWLGPAVCFLANALSYVAVLWALAQIDVAGTPSKHPESLGLRSLLGGFAYLLGRPGLLLLVLMVWAAAMCGWPSQSLLPAVAEHALQMPQAYGLMLSGTGAGALAAALTVARFGSREPRRPFIAAGIAVVSIDLVALSQVDQLSVAIVCNAFIGFGLILFLSTSQSVMQLSADEHNRGRLMGIWAMVLSGGVPFGNLVVGPAADHWGEGPVLCAQGIALGTVGLMLLLLWWMWRKPRERL